MCVQNEMWNKIIVLFQFKFQCQNYDFKTSKFKSKISKSMSKWKSSQFLIWTSSPDIATEIHTEIQRYRGTKIFWGELSVGQKNAREITFTCVSEIKDIVTTFNHTGT